MDKDAVIATLRAHRADIERLGIMHVALFGSLARDEAGPQSDIDIAFELMEGKEIGVWEYAGLQQKIGEFFSGEVDVVDRGSAKPWLRAEIDRDAVYAF